MIRQKIKILFVLQDLEIGGAERLRLTVEKYIDKDKYDTIYCCITKIGAIGEAILHAGGRVISLDSDGSFYNLMATYKLYKTVREIKPDIIHSALFNANFHSRIVGILTRKPVIAEEHGMNMWKRRRHMLIDKILARYTHRIIAVSNSVKDFLIREEGIDPDKIAVLYNCVDIESLKTRTTRDEERMKLSSSSTDFVIGAVGNLRKEKGHTVLLGAFKKVLEKHHNAKLFIAGTGSLYVNLVKRAEELSIEKNVFFVGKIFAIAGFLKALDLFVMPSISEGFPISLIEAIVAGVPCIASNVGGIREVAQGAKDVTLVEPNNPQVLAEFIINEIENRRKRPDESIAVQDRVKEIFMPKPYIDRLDEIYNRALK